MICLTALTNIRDSSRGSLWVVEKGCALALEKNYAALTLEEDAALALEDDGVALTLAEDAAALALMEEAVEYKLVSTSMVPGVLFVGPLGE